MEKKQSEFNKVFSAWDILVIAFGAMIGWGWVVSSGGWIQKGGVLGAALGFVVGGVMIFFVGLTYAELTAAMPQCGGEHVWSHRAMGPTGSFVCTWAIVLGYVGVACFEACAFPTIISYLWPGFLKGYLYTVAGFDIYASWLIVAIIVAFCIMLINIVGAKTAAKLQTILTIIIGGAGILLIVASVINGTVDNLDGQMFAEVGGGGIVKSILSVAVISPFYLIGFDVIPQAAEEINVPPKKIGGMLILSVVLAVLKLTPLAQPAVETRDEKLFFALVRAAFNMRRKTLVNALGPVLASAMSKEEIVALVEAAGLDARIRGERLSLADYAKLADLASEKLNKG